jgi:hypothetical protein
MMCTGYYVTRTSDDMPLTQCTEQMLVSLPEQGSFQ